MWSSSCLTGTTSCSIPLPNLVFTKDSSFWIGDRVAVASLAAERRRRETDLATILYRYHPRFAGTKWLYESDLEHLDGGDVLLLAPGVVAIGVGQRTTPAGAERLARRLFEAGLAHAVLAVPISQQGGAGHLDTVCAVLDSDAVVMHPAVAYTLTAHTISPRADGMRMSRPQPFLEAAAQAMGIDRLHVIDSGMDPIWGQPGQRDDGSNVLAIGPGLAVSHERNSETNARLEAAGVRVIRVPSSELGSVRGGPRCMTCPVSREPAALPAEFLAEPRPAACGPLRPAPASAGGISVPDSREASQPGAVEHAAGPRACGSRVGVGAAAARQLSERRARPVGLRPDWRDHCDWRPLSDRPRRKTPNARQTTPKISAIIASQMNVLTTAMATSTTTIAATIRSNMRSMVPPYVRRPRPGKPARRLSGPHAAAEIVPPLRAYFCAKPFLTGRAETPI